MAQMHSRIPVSRMQRGELMVYKAMSCLPQDWVIFHSCKEDYREDDRYVHFEADFVLLVPGRGIVVVEVKDWPEVQVVNGHWQSRRNSSESWKTHTQSPLEQANITLQKLMRSLARCGCIPHAANRWPEHRHMAVLTRIEPTTAKDNNIPFGELYLCGTDNLQQHIEDLFILQQPERMTSARIQKISDALAPSILFRMSLKNYLQEMDASAADILHLLPAVYESTGGIRVEGCAGTGKTVMACAEAARLASELPRDGKHRILMLCFNHAMAYELQQNPLLAEQSDMVLVSTFHDYCIEHILIPRGLGYLVNYTRSGDRLPDAALEKIQELLPGLPQYDAVFVDEAQDFREVWWSIIRGLLTEKGKFYIFADKHQDLYDRYTHLPELCTRIRLSTNLRNARQIAGFSRAMLPEEEQRLNILPMAGAGIHLAGSADSPEARAEQVSCIINLLLESQSGIRPCDIVVLSPWRTSHPRCSLNLVARLATAPADELPAEAAERRAACRRPDASQIFASTIKSFKGQEAPYIIVTDIIGLGESRGFDMKELYTACTRARYGLYLVATSSGQDLIETFSASYT